MGSDLDVRVLKGYAVGGKTKNKGIEGLDQKHVNLFSWFLVYRDFRFFKLLLELSEVRTKSCTSEPAY